MKEAYDVVVLGGGTGGYIAAIRASQLGLSVAVVEREKLGGTCLHRGCIPSKALLRSAEVLATVRKAGDFGVEAGTATLNIGRVHERKRGVVEQLHQGVIFLMRKYRIDVVYGNGRILPPSIFSPRGGAVAVEQEDGEVVTLANNTLIIATGSRPRMLQGLEADGGTIMTSDEALVMEELPASMIIVGGGVIGVEWASMLNDFGVDVTVLEYENRLIPLEDEDVSREMERQLVSRGVRVVCGVRVDPASVRAEDGGVTLSAMRLSGGEEGETLEFAAEKLLVSVGRQPNTDGIGLENTDVKVDSRGAIQVNGWGQTAVPHIYAIGDCTGGPQLAHAAAHAGAIAAEHAAGKAELPFEGSRVPRCIYTRPEAASVGLTEKQAAAAGRRTKLGRFPFKALGKALVHGEPEGFVKVVVDADSDEVLGVHMIGPHATDMIAEAALIQLLDASPWEMSKLVRPHPTLSEALGEALLAVDGKSLGM